MDEAVLKIREAVFARMDLTKEITDEEVEVMISEETAKYAKGRCLSLQTRSRIEMMIFNSMRGLDILQDLVDDPLVTEIMVNGSRHIFYEREGCVYQYDKTFSSEEKMQDIIQQIVGRHNRVVNQASPIVDTRLADGSRVNIVLAPVAMDGAAISIRKFPAEPFTMDELVLRDFISQEAADFLAYLVRAGYNIFISGGTSSGKTTFLNALSQFIPHEERIITIEDSAELQLLEIPNLVRLETRNANTEGLEEISIRSLIKTALRMRPDRIIVGECRGAEALDMLQAMNTGHDGSLSTGHANSCKDMLSRLETMVLMGMELPLTAIRQQIASGIDILVHLGRLRDKSRHVLDIVEVDEIKNGEVQLHTLYHFEETAVSGKNVKGKLVCKGRLLHRQKLKTAGFEEEL